MPAIITGAYVMAGAGLLGGLLAKESADDATKAQERMFQENVRRQEEARKRALSALEGSRVVRENNALPEGNQNQNQSMNQVRRPQRPDASSNFIGPQRQAQRKPVPQNNPRDPSSGLLGSNSGGIYDIPNYRI